MAFVINSRPLRSPHFERSISLVTLSFFEHTIGYSFATLCDFSGRSVLPGGSTKDPILSAVLLGFLRVTPSSYRLGRRAHLRKDSLFTMYLALPNHCRYTRFLHVYEKT